MAEQVPTADQALAELRREWPATARDAAARAGILELANAIILLRDVPPGLAAKAKAKAKAEAEDAPAQADLFTEGVA
jgi:hypothetical protein